MRVAYDTDRKFHILVVLLFFFLFLTWQSNRIDSHVVMGQINMQTSKRRRKRAFQGTLTKRLECENRVDRLCKKFANEERRKGKEAYRTVQVTRRNEATDFLLRVPAHSQGDRCTCADLKIVVHATLREPPARKFYFLRFASAVSRSVRHPLSLSSLEDNF